MWRETINKARLLGALIAALAVFPTAATATAAPEQVTDYGGGCVIDPNNRAVTVDSLRFRCTPEQQDTIYAAASAGAVPSGVKNGWIGRPPFMQQVAPPLWLGKTFYTGYTGPNSGGYLMNRVTGAGLEAWRADIRPGPSPFDGKPSWLLDYAPSPTPQLLDEIREVSPGVWFGYSWWRGALQTPLLLTFILA